MDEHSAVQSILYDEYCIISDGRYLIGPLFESPSLATMLQSRLLHIQARKRQFF